MNFSNLLRQKTGIILIILFSLLSVGRLLHQESKQILGIKFNDEVSLYEERYVELKKWLPPNGVVGYINNKDFGNDIREFYLTQYSLAPIIVVRSANFPLVIGNFPTSVNSPGKQMNSVLLKDFGNGVMLFSKTVQ